MASDNDRATTWVELGDESSGSTTFRCIIDGCNRDYPSRRALGSHQGRMHRRPAAAAERRRRRMPRPDTEKPCASCSQSFGRHFTTYDGARRGALDFEDGHEVLKDCDGFAIAWEG